VIYASTHDKHGKATQLVLFHAAGVAITQHVKIRAAERAVPFWPPDWT